jgi:hypothetical protein
LSDATWVPLQSTASWAFLRRFVTSAIISFTNRGEAVPPITVGVRGCAGRLGVRSPSSPSRRARVDAKCIRLSLAPFVQSQRLDAKSACDGESKAPQAVLNGRRIAHKR